ncbi:hypothetical protein B566_EDAN013022 [Ephemera danica]|nr:hypothetical protein B566_EDAN013022 [Ephemera danica]
MTFFTVLGMFVGRLFKVLIRNYKLRRENATPATMLSAQAAANPDKPCFIFQGRTWTFRQMNEYSWRIARVFSRRGLSHGDVVALMSTNRPEYVATWLGLSRLGVVTALINTNLLREVLGEDCQMLRLCGADQLDQESVEEPDFALLDKEVRDALCSPIEGLAPPNYLDKLLYVYLFITMATQTMLPLHSEDRIYNPLPLYHTAGGIMGVGPAVCCDADRSHCVRLMVGNGLRTAIWEPFVKRFGVKQIVELYGATEGNTNIVNVDGTVGAVGFLPNLLPHSLFPIGLVKVDEDTGELLRAGPNNLCIPCKPATKKKIAHSVYSPGDKVFVSGDILVMDEKGYLYFKDRTGDTFRWKGENVATAEVEAAISNAIGLKDACVYGVEVPGAEGRAGMATILDADHTIDLSVLGKSVAKSLPPYAQPIKAKNDKLYFNPGGKGEYKELTASLYEDIMSGRVRV